MKKVLKAFFLVVTFSFSLHGYAQDVITKKDGIDVQAKILEVTAQEIKYKRFDNQTGPTFTLSKAEVLMVRYENGSRDVFDQTNISTSDSNDSYDLIEKGKQDALMNYSGKNSGKGGVAATAIVFGPLIGLIPAALITSSEPAEENLQATDLEMMKNPNYRKGYTDQAEKTKKKKVWKSYGIASGVWLGIIIAAYAVGGSAY